MPIEEVISVSGLSAAPARRQHAITPSDVADITIGARTVAMRAIEVLTDGDVTIVAVDDVTAAGVTDTTKAITRTCVAGQIINVQTRRVMDTGTDATVVGLYGG